MPHLRLSSALDELLKQCQAPPLAFTDYQDWKTYFTTLATEYTASWQLALHAGFFAPGIGYSFAGGYQSALRALVDKLPADKLAALCVTEDNGNHPRAIATTLNRSDNQLIISGSKKFITGGAQSDILLVACQEGSDERGLPKIKLVSIPHKTAGIDITAMPELPFVPEIDHAAVTFTNVHLTQEHLLPGDGYADYVKPFRTIEDIHVALSICAYVLRTSLVIAAPQPIKEKLLSITANHCLLCQQPPLSPTTHLMLNGSRESLMQTLMELEPYWEKQAPTSFKHWLRDKAILKVASSARETRTEKAWQQVSAYSL